MSLKEGEENFCVIVVSLLVLFFCTLTFYLLWCVKKITILFIICFCDKKGGKYFIYPSIYDVYEYARMVSLNALLLIF